MTLPAVTVELELVVTLLMLAPPPAWPAPAVRWRDGPALWWVPTLAPPREADRVDRLPPPPSLVRLLRLPPPDS